MIEYYQNSKRSVHLMNLDPAAEDFPIVTPSVDVRDLVCLSDVMEECSLGPNGGLLFCFEYLMDRLDWLEDQMGDFSDDFLIVDCPGQIELYTHIPVMKSLIQTFQDRFNYKVCTAYLMESQVRQSWMIGVLSYHISIHHLVYSRSKQILFRGHVWSQFHDPVGVSSSQYLDKG